MILDKPKYSSNRFRLKVHHYSFHYGTDGLEGLGWVPGDDGKCSNTWEHFMEFKGLVDRIRDTPRHSAVGVTILWS